MLGFGGNVGMVIIGSVDWDEWDFSIFVLMDEISEKLIVVLDVCVFVIMCSGIFGGGFGCLV